MSGLLESLKSMYAHDAIVLAGIENGSVRGIPLTQGKIAIVDAEDYEKLAKHKWYAHKTRNTSYAARSVRMPANKKIMLLMHREIFNLLQTDKIIIDHIDRNGVNNLRCNLRIASQSINIHNSKKFSNNTSGFRGVTWEKRRKKWQAQIVQYGRNIFCGYFSTPVDAAKARDIAAIRHYGESAILNFPKGDTQ